MTASKVYKNIALTGGQLFLFPLFLENHLTFGDRVSVRPFARGFMLSFCSPAALATACRTCSDFRRYPSTFFQ